VPVCPSRNSKRSVSSDFVDTSTISTLDGILSSSLLRVCHCYVVTISVLEGAPTPGLSKICIWCIQMNCGSTWRGTTYWEEGRKVSTGLPGRSMLSPQTSIWGIKAQMPHLQLLATILCSGTTGFFPVLGLSEERLFSGFYTMIWHFTPAPQQLLSLCCTAWG
jgi:hypothetical protein